MFAVFTVTLAEYYRCLDCTWLLSRRTARLPPVKERWNRQENSWITPKKHPLIEYPNVWLQTKDSPSNGMNGWIRTEWRLLTSLITIETHVKRKRNKKNEFVTVEFYSISNHSWKWNVDCVINILTKHACKYQYEWNPHFGLW